MRKCRLTITTIADGQENTITREGEMCLTAEKIQLFYREENATVSMQIQEENVQVERQGDYSLRLRLTRGEITSGELGISGACGEIETITHTVQYSVSENSLLLSLKYDLMISGEIQKMQIRLLGRYKD